MDFCCMTSPDPMIVICKSQHSIMEIEQVLMTEELAAAINRPLQVEKWELPTPGWVKLNCDGTQDPMKKKVSIGVILRDDSGMIIRGANREAKAKSAIIAKAMAVKEGLQLAKNKVHCGSGINIWQDSWVLGVGRLERIGDGVIPLSTPQKVSKIIDHEDHCWKDEGPGDQKDFNRPLQVEKWDDSGMIIRGANRETKTRSAIIVKAMVVKEGLQLAKNKGINIWQDNWVIGIGRLERIEDGDIPLNAPQKVSEIIDLEDHCWKDEGPGDQKDFNRCI
ncbi:hypothetical protein COLO4_36007 [Corchorus olitorius]|uniref:RNase H type-1 domain-containing protein n=1 Tax=Corchorus olitorius TaxID=93759 RepID=A0A1R3GBE5_9ROSI|nr:hypothetical protein COLO4_36007 [Corchorus olitorius]